MSLNLEIDRSEPEARPGRPFRLSDAIVLMAALSVALAWDRGRLHDPMRWSSDVPRPAGWVWRIVTDLANAIALVPPFLAMGSLAVLALRLRKPRPGLRQLLRQPGAVACALASLFVVPACSAVLASHLLSGKPPAVAWARTVQDLRPENLTIPSIVIGIGVSVAWIARRATDAWRPEPGWIDRLGRLVGLGWIAMILGGLLLPFLALAGLSSLVG